MGASESSGDNITLWVLYHTMFDQPLHCTSMAWWHAGEVMVEVGVEAEHLSLQPLKDPQVGHFLSAFACNETRASHMMRLSAWQSCTRLNQVNRKGATVWLAGISPCMPVRQI